MPGKAVDVVVTVQVATDVARALLETEPRNAVARELLSVLDEHGAALTPMHPGTNEPELMQWFTVEVPDRTTAEQLVALLQGRREIETAYLKSPDEMP